MNFCSEKILWSFTSGSISPQFELSSQQLICENLVELMGNKGLYQNIQIPTKFDVNFFASFPDDKVFDKLYKQQINIAKISLKVFHLNGNQTS